MRLTADMVFKESIIIVFQYNSIKNGVINCTYNLPTNNPRSKRYIDSMPIIYIPAYLDYYNELMSLESFLMLLDAD